MTYKKTIDYWGYQILEFDFDKKEMKAECYAIGNKELVVDNILIDSFSRTLGKAAPKKAGNQGNNRRDHHPALYVQRKSI